MCVELLILGLTDGHLLDHVGLSGRARGAGCGGGWLLLKDLPELQALIGSSSGQHLSIWAETAVKNTGLVGGNLNVADKSWVAPDADGVVWETAGADNLAVVWAPSETGDLGTSVDAVDTGTSGGVPEVNVTIV